MKVARYRWFTLPKKTAAFICSKVTERERKVSWELLTWKSLSLEKQFFASAAFLAWMLAWRRILTHTFFLTNIIAHFHVLSVTSIVYGQNVNKQYLTDKAILGKMGGLYVTNVANVDKGQWSDYTGILFLKLSFSAKLNSNLWDEYGYLLNAGLLVVLHNAIYICTHQLFKSCWFMCWKLRNSISKLISLHL